eukprot:m.373777 g.373777  ORF g.373777 m.373777 type:complete len:86 (+) comp69149_c0_seq1:43-300(+)
MHSSIDRTTVKVALTGFFEGFESLSSPVVFTTIIFCQVLLLQSSRAELVRVKFVIVFVLFHPMALFYHHLDLIYRDQFHTFFFPT